MFVEKNRFLKCSKKKQLIAVFIAKANLCNKFSLCLPSFLTFNTIVDFIVSAKKPIFFLIYCIKLKECKRSNKRYCISENVRKSAYNAIPGFLINLRKNQTVCKYKNNVINYNTYVSRRNMTGSKNNRRHRCTNPKRKYF